MSCLYNVSHSISLLQQSGLLSDLCYSSWLRDTWENVTLTAQEADVVSVTVVEEERSAFSHRILQFHLAKTSQSSWIQQWQLLLVFIVGWSDISGMAEVCMYLLTCLFESSNLYGKNIHMWNCLLEFLHYLHVFSGQGLHFSVSFGSRCSFLWFKKKKDRTQSLQP